MPAIEKLVLVGAGLIGGSFSLALRAAGAVGKVVGVGRTAASMAEAMRLGIVDEVASDFSCAADATMVMLAMPVGQTQSVLHALAPHVGPATVVTDAGSTKGDVIAAARAELGAALPRFVPGHPVAGTEQSGPEAGFAELFDGRWCILTPVAGTDPTAVEKLKNFWERCGSKVDTMDPGHHDLVLAIVSHVPHLIAYNIVGTAADLETVTQSEVIKYSASGFRDFTRIAASDPTMWRDIFLNNREAVLEMLGRFNEDLSVLQRAIRYGDGDALFNLFTRTRAIRRSIIEAGQDTAAPDFGRSPKAK